MSARSSESTEFIDTQFTPMADDKAYWVLNLTLADEFAESDWEALIVEESEPCSSPLNRNWKKR